MINPLTDDFFKKHDAFFKETFNTTKTINNKKCAINKLVSYTNTDVASSVNNMNAIRYIAYDMKNKDDLYMINTSYSYISDILSFITQFNDKVGPIAGDNIVAEITKIHLDLHQKRSDMNDKQLPRSEATIENCFELMNSFDKDSKEYLFLACNLLIPPRRVQDWRLAKFVTKLPETLDENINYVIYNKYYDTIYKQNCSLIRLYYNVFKPTVRKVLGPWDRTIYHEDTKDWITYDDIIDDDTKMNQEQLALLLIKHFKEDTFLFGEKNERQFATFMDNIFKMSPVKMTQKDIRNIRITQFKKKSPSIIDCRNFAHDMGQSSLEMQMLYETVRPETNSNIQLVNDVAQESIQQKIIKSIADDEKQIKILQEQIIKKKNDLESLNKIFEQYS